MVEISGYQFEGPYRNVDETRNEPGVYAVLCQRLLAVPVVDVGESNAVKDRLADHDRVSCWEQNCREGRRAYAVRYMPSSSLDERREVERQIRRRERPPCGER